jgi:Domain of unknown function (DUF4956)
MEALLQTKAFVDKLAIAPLLLRTLLVLVTSQVLAWHYIRFAKVLANKRKFAHVLIGLSVTTFLVITVIKTSLALSLGLVGALSIIRFRTPIKEAEELVYLFIAIAVGLGIGANQTVPTLVICGVLLLYGALSTRMGPTRRFNRSLLQVNVPMQAEEGPAGDDELRTLVEAVEKHASNVDLRRVDTHGGEFNANMLVDTRSIDDVGKLLAAIREAMPKASVTVVDREILD